VSYPSHPPPCKDLFVIRKQDCEGQRYIEVFGPGAQPRIGGTAGWWPSSLLLDHGGHGLRFIAVLREKDEAACFLHACQACQG